MFRQKWILLTTLACISANSAWGQGPPDRVGGLGGRNEGPAAGRNGVPDQINRQQVQVQAAQERIQAQANQRATQQAERRMMDGANRAAERAVQMSAQQAALGPAGRGSPGTQVGSSGWYPICPEPNGAGADLGRRVAADRAPYPEDLTRDVSDSEGKRKFPKFSKQGLSGFVKKVFGFPKSAEAPMTAGSAQNATLPTENSALAMEYRQARAAAAGANANPNAKLANAIRVRQTQISTLRDLAIETGDSTLMERADQLEQNLQILLANQARLQANLGIVASEPTLPTDPTQVMQPVDTSEFELVESIPVTPVGYQSTSSLEPDPNAGQ